MALITDPDSLNQGVEITISTAAKTITLSEAGNLSADGVTLQALYSFLKEEWKTDATLIPYPFPMVAITPEQFEFVDSWIPANNATRKLIRTGGWSEVDATDVINRQYMGVITLGNIDATDKTTGDKAYFSFSSAPSQTFFTYAGPVNESVQIYGDVDNGDFDYRSDTMTVFIRIQGKSYDQTTSVDIGLSSLTYKVERFPLGEDADLKITHDDSTIETTAPYTSMGIEFFAAAQTKTGFSDGSHDFGIVVSGATGTVEQIYEFIQYSLRQNTDIDDGTSTQTGTLTDAMAQFVGDRLDTLSVTNSEGGGTGVFLDNVATDDTNSMRMIDNAEVYAEYPFVATGAINFNVNLQNDANAIYRMYFTYTHGSSVSDLAISASTGTSASIDSAGADLPVVAQNDYIYISGMSNAENNGIWQVTDASPTTSQFDADKVDGVEPIDETAASGFIGHNPFASPDAVLVQDNSSVDISGDVGGAASVGYDFDYDGNVQGGRTAGEDANITVVALGHETAQYVSATGTIKRTTGNNISLVAALERNYSNPV